MLKNSIYAVITTGGLLVIPILGNFLVDGWNWDAIDFIVMGALLYMTSFILISIFRRTTHNTTSKLILGGLVILIFLLIWIELGVGIFGTPWAGS